MPRVSIGLPVYNGARFLPAALDSLVTQTVDDYELIIADNASTDATPQICHDYATRDPRIRYLRNDRNIGLNANVNRVVALSSGTFFKLAAADDLAAPTCLEKCLQVLEQHPEVVLCYGKTTLIDEGGQTLGRYEDGLNLTSADPGSRFRQVIDRTGLVNALHGVARARTLKATAGLRRYPGSDVALLAELALHGRFWEVPEYLFFRRMHGAALSGQKTRAAKKAYVDPDRAAQPVRDLTLQFAAYLGAVWHAPVPGAQKLALTWDVLRRVAWSRHALAREWRPGWPDE